MMKASCKLELVKWKCLESRHYYVEFPPEWCCQRAVIVDAAGSWCPPPDSLRVKTAVRTAWVLLSSRRVELELLFYKQTLRARRLPQWGGKKGFFSASVWHNLQFILKVYCLTILQWIPFVIFVISRSCQIWDIMPMEELHRCGQKESLQFSKKYLTGASPRNVLIIQMQSSYFLQCCSAAAVVLRNNWPNCSKSRLNLSMIFCCCWSNKCFHPSLISLSLLETPSSTQPSPGKSHPPCCP